MKSDPRYICRATKRRDWAFKVFWFDGEQPQHVLVRTQSAFWAGEVCRLFNEARVREDWAGTADA